jgi:hypothetical protein
MQFRHLKDKFWRMGARVMVEPVRGLPDHATVMLQEWHEVVMNTETRSQAMRDVAFLD